MGLSRDEIEAIAARVEERIAPRLDAIEKRVLRIQEQLKPARGRPSHGARLSLSPKQFNSLERLEAAFTGQFTVRDARELLGDYGGTTSYLLAQLAKQGFLHRVRRGLYTLTIDP